MNPGPASPTCPMELQTHQPHGPVSQRLAIELLVSLSALADMYLRAPSL